MAYMEIKMPFRSTQFWLNSFRYESKGKYFGSDQCRYLLFICIFSSILCYLVFGVPPLLCFEIILIVFSLLICY